MPGDFDLPVGALLQHNGYVTYHVRRLLATLGGAKALGLGDQIGSLSVGKQADVVVVGQHAPGQLPEHDPVSLLVYGTQGSDVRHVLVDGELLVKNGELQARTGLDVERLRAHCAERMPPLLRRAGLR